jgi:hypothetical protein
MGLIPSPRPLTKKEFIKAIKEGKTSLFEVDPAFADWYKYGHFGKNIFSYIFNKFRKIDDKIIKE